MSRSYPASWSFPRVLASSLAGLAVALGTPATATGQAPGSSQQCSRTLTADVVALDQPIFYNRLGAFDPAAMIYALRRDVVAKDPLGGLTPGNVQLREGKRPRPLTLRLNVGDCLTVNFQNLLSLVPANDEQPATRTAGVHVMGMQLVGGIASDGSNVGQNASSLVAPGGSATYTFFGERDGTYLLYSTAATTGGEGDGGSLARGLFGAVNVEPRDAEWYRSQLTAEELSLATVKDEMGVARTTAAGQPIIDYRAVYPAGHAQAGLPILAMLRGNEIVHADINGIITGPSAGEFSPGAFPKVPTSPARFKPFREFTVIFHDEIGIVQAFPVFDDPKFEAMLAGGRDGFAINYGAAGAGAEIIANREKVGPMWNCPECKMEEFFLTSWAVGDPAMVVDVPANARDASGALIVGPKATKVFFPDDPSNVHHSYLGDHVKFRNLHAGPKEHHIFHLHAHQWLNTQDSDNSTYKDSQMIGPGAGFTYEISHNGSGNRNKTVGDAIFHCHFYPHFAQGMWELWRTHDVFETGTVLEADGRVASGARALPDGEIAAGTPIPAVVPMPGQALPVMPGTAGNKGYPFYIPGVAGHRAPKPPLETVFDGGLPRHVIVGGQSTFPALNLTDFSKVSVTLDAVAVPEQGTADEKSAMAFHGARTHDTFRVDPNTFAVSPDKIVTNGLPAVAGAPFADPCVSDDGAARNQKMRYYKSASFQTDVKYNKAGWHFPQHRMMALWEDVKATIAGTRTPEPLFMRTATGDCIQFNYVNLVPLEYKLDDFQVLTPTDVIGQHIHLVKFDVTSSDGASNGFNYEDGNLAPGEVVERVHAIRKFQSCVGRDSGDPRDGTITCPVAKAHPFFGAGTGGEWIGAQETIQRWYADDVLNNAGDDRTLRSVFTHDHFGPSTHQQTGLYAGLVAEPAGSRWRDPETGVFLSEGRADGGPTSWRADVLTSNPDSSFREFNVAIADFALAYQKDNAGFPDPRKAINPEGKFQIGLPDLLAPPVDGACPNGTPAPCPGLISVDDPGTMLVNYRNEPLALRVRDPLTNKQAADVAGDLSMAFANGVARADPTQNTQPTFYKPLTGGVGPTDPFTPLFRAYEGDRVQVRILNGAQEEGRNATVHGVKWLAEPSDRNSGYRNSQAMGLSEHFEFLLPPLPGDILSKKADYMYQFGASTDDLWNGTWGILRSYQSSQKDLLVLPSNPDGKATYLNKTKYNGVCHIAAPIRSYSVTAVAASTALPNGTLVYNSRTGNRGPLHDPTAIMFVRTSDLDATGKLLPGVPVEPLILRAAAGDCIEVTLVNRLPAPRDSKKKEPLPDLDGFFTLPMIVNGFNANDVAPSRSVGLHPQLLAFDVTGDNGVNVGDNKISTVEVSDANKKYRWYAGDLTVNAAGDLVSTPVEFGATNLISSDPIQHAGKGAVGALIVEPQGSTWVEDAKTRMAATVTGSNGESFREFVAIFQNAVNLRFGDDNSAVPNTAEAEDSEDSGQKGFNYRTEPMWKRMGFPPNAPLGHTRTLDFTNVLSNSQVGGDPVTPVFTAVAGQAVRFRVLHPGGNQRNNVFQVHGHVWQEMPYESTSLASSKIGFNKLSEWKGSVTSVGPSSHFDLVLQNGAGGMFKVPGDYLFRDQASFQFDGGLWGLLRVLPSGSTPP